MPRPWFLLGALLLVACAAPQSAPTVPAAAGSAELAVEVVAEGFENPWDIGFLPDGQALVTERGARLSLLSGARVTPVQADLADVQVRGEGGLMGLVVHPDFAQSRRFTTCQTHNGPDGNDIRLVTWQLSPDGSSAVRVVDPLVGGLPLNPSGRHSGCRPTLATDGSLLVGTGDTARGALPQDLTSLGGKILRVDLATGGPARGNPFLMRDDPRTRIVLSYGHRNVQGVAVHPDTGRAYSAEHGPDVDDEVNRVVPGANHGWDPAQGGTAAGYDESVPMTDTRRFPQAEPAVWASGSPTLAISGLSFLTGQQWGELDGALAVCALKGQRLLIMTLAADGSVATVTQPAALDGTYGRLRAARQGPDGALYVTTDNGGGDKVLRITRRG
ncbi:PQQ-dependent sugar dehydrogenase [Pseudonocardia sp. CA-107938]|uniref:PQQ-dependent sugar dehydrogenase n=1 Tax=Pseudonocardia sp. CA-107938 TaxID=3240021 RepID=UPI003D8BF62E